MENQTLINKYIERLNKSAGLDNVRRNVEDNKIYFDYKEKEYRVRMPNYKEKKIINSLKREKFLELVGTAPCRDKLIIDLEKSGKSISAIQREIDNLNMDKEKYQELLAKEAKTDSEKEDKEAIEKLITQISTIVYRQVELSVYKNQLLAPCLEIQMQDMELEAIILTLLEKKVEDRWERVYASKEDLDKEEDEEFLNNAAELARDLGVYRV